MNNLEDLNEKINDFTNKNKSKKTKSFRSRSVLTDLIAGIVVGGFIGYKLDEIFLVKPICFIICLILGCIASIWLIYKNFKE